MRCALEGAAVRVAPSMNAQEVANTVWALRNGNSDCQTSTWSFLGSTCEANCAGELADVPVDVAGIKSARADGRDRAIGDHAIVNDSIIITCLRCRSIAGSQPFGTAGAEDVSKGML